MMGYYNIIQNITVEKINLNLPLNYWIDMAEWLKHFLDNYKLISLEDKVAQALLIQIFIKINNRLVTTTIQEPKKIMSIKVSPAEKYMLEYIFKEEGVKVPEGKIVFFPQEIINQIDKMDKNESSYQKYIKNTSLK